MCLPQWRPQSAARERTGGRSTVPRWALHESTQAGQVDWLLDGAQSDWQGQPDVVLGAPVVCRGLVRGRVHDPDRSHETRAQARASGTVVERHQVLGGEQHQVAHMNGSVVAPCHPVLVFHLRDFKLVPAGRSESDDRSGRGLCPGNVGGLPAHVARKGWAGAVGHLERGESCA